MEIVGSTPGCSPTRSSISSVILESSFTSVLLLRRRPVSLRITCCAVSESHVIQSNDKIITLIRKGCSRVFDMLFVFVRFPSLHVIESQCMVMGFGLSII